MSLKTAARFNNSGVANWPERFADLASKAQDPRLIDYYQQGVVSGDTPLSEVPFVALDFETTGLDSQNDAILTIGLVPFSLQRIRCKESAHWVINPHREMNEESVIIHGITDSDVKQAPDLNIVLEEVLNALAGKVVVVHYKKIEREFIHQALLVRLAEGIEFPVIDTLDLEAFVQREQCKGWLNWLKGKKPGSVRLAHARERYGLPAYAPHHALTDALATAELWQAQVAYHFEPSMPIKLLWQ
ncbi:3'-5' exonuclease [Vibrio sp. SM6]|uniref:3'-5' exonuclease n=1 Tax=Vibrio agarilyticus TaxID=2726741 RepID=A0A7X8TQU1_9VIBR|nr:3'-5' exonuclease [Vibrio agarilyticus]NLS13064.1 3'-5' exonuclease [Vibrio agarilyticus]